MRTPPLCASLFSRIVCLGLSAPHTPQPNLGPSPLSGWGARPAADGPEPCPGSSGWRCWGGLTPPLGPAAALWSPRPEQVLRARRSGSPGPTRTVNVSDGARLLGSPLLLRDAARLKLRRSESNDPGDLCSRSNLQLYFETNLIFFCKGKPVCEIEKSKNPQTNFLSLLFLSFFKIKKGGR